MKAKRLLTILMLSLLSFVSACTLTTTETTDTTVTTQTMTDSTTESSTETTTVAPTDGIGEATGLANATIITNHYFHALKGVDFILQRLFLTDIHNGRLSLCSQWR